MRAPLALAVGLLSGSLAGCGGGGEPEVIVYAAASTSDVVRDLADRFEAEHRGVIVRVSLGATSTLTRQIAAGAPPGVVLAADPEWAAWLAEQGGLDGPARPLARGGLVVVARPEWEGRDWTAARRLALADPAHVPAGRYARRALEATGLWARLAPRVIPTADVRAALAAVETGAADAAVVYASDTLAAPDLPVVHRFRDADAPPILYAGSVTRGGSDLDRAFLQMAAASRDVWARRGFRPPSP